MSRIVKLALLLVLITYSHCQISSGSIANDTSIQEAEDNKQPTVLDTVQVFLFANGIKVAKGIIELKQMIDSISTLSKLGTDLDQYAIAHRGVFLTNVVVYSKQDADIIIQKVTEKISIIPYRYIKTDLDCSSDPFLGYSCLTFFKKGSKTEDYGVNLAFTFGYCQEGMDITQVKNIETTIELLTTSNKAMLAEKIKSADDAAQQYVYYNKLYDDAVSKRDFASQIPGLQKQLDDKNVECGNLQKTYTAAQSNYENELQTYNDNKAQITTLTNDINSLTAKKSALETEQISRNNSKVTFETRTQHAKELAEDISAAFQLLVKTIDPQMFNGNECFDGEKISQDCLDILNQLK